MNTKEMQNTDGGSVIGVVLAVAVVVATAIDYTQDGKVDGYIRI